MIPKGLATYPLPTSAELPEPKVDWTFRPERAALLIHDMQQYFMEFYSSEFSELTSNIDRLRSLGLPTIYTAQPPNQSTEERGLLLDRWGSGPDDRVGIIDALKPHADDRVLTKRRYSAFHASELAEIMRAEGRDQLVICGVYAHIGITATALDAFSLNIAPFVVADAVADFDRERHTIAIHHMAATCALVTVTDALLPASTPSLSEVRQQVLALLDEPVGDDDDLMEAGLDSIRVMNLIEQWKAHGIEVSFADLAAEPTIAGFHACLAGE